MTNDIIIEVRLSRALAVEFKSLMDNGFEFPESVLEAYKKLQQHYEYCINKELS